MGKLHFSIFFIIFSLVVAEDSSVLPNSTIVNAYRIAVAPMFLNETQTDEKNFENKSSVPRKGVELPSDETQSLNISSTSIPMASGEKKEPSKPRKGADLFDIGAEQKKEPSKPRKGAVLFVNESDDKKILGSVTHISVVKFKPTASGLDPLGDVEDSEPSTDLTALTVGLSLGVVLVLIIASVSYWRLRDVWSRRQYKRVDFLIDGMYVDA